MQNLVLVSALAVCGLSSVALAAGEKSCATPCAAQCCGGTMPVGVVSQWPVTRIGTGLQNEPADPMNGRVWVSRPVIGGVESGGRSISEKYGAYDARDARIAVEIDPLFRFQSGMVGVINPWKVQNDRSIRRNPYGNSYNDAQDKIADRLESARQQWLKDNNFVGGVRTFVNDANGLKPATTGEITPRATIELAPGAPRPAPRPAKPFRVDASPKVPVQAGTAQATATDTRISMPVIAPAPVIRSATLAAK